MPQIVARLADISDRYDTLFCDLWGCLHNGKTPYPEAVAALQAFRLKGGKVVLMTNAPRPNVFVIRQLQSMGVPTDAFDIVVSSGDAAQAAMLSGAVGQKVWHLGPAKDDGFFTELPDNLRDAVKIERVALSDAEGIVCTGPFDEMTEVPEDYHGQFLLAKTKGLKLLCANPDLVVDLGDRRIYCAGALAQFYDQMGGESLYFGKPYPPIYDLARNRLAAVGYDIDAARVLAVGDGIGTDIQGGIADGIDTLFVTGGLEAEAFGVDVEQPDEILLNQWLTERQLSPTFAIGRLR